MLDGEPIFFDTEEGFRQWLIQHHEEELEIWVGYYKKHTGIPSITWPESVDQALCFGWIDGLRRSIDDKAYKMRFTPRKKKSHWSAVNIDKINALIDLDLVYPAGLKAFKLMEETNSKRASHEQKEPKLALEYQKKLASFPEAFDYFINAAPYYQRAAAWWVMSAKQESTRQRRLKILIESCAQGLKIPSMR